MNIGIFAVTFHYFGVMFYFQIVILSFIDFKGKAVIGMAFAHALHLLYRDNLEEPISLQFREKSSTFYSTNYI